MGSVVPVLVFFAAICLWYIFNRNTSILVVDISSLLHDNVSASERKSTVSTIGGVCHDVGFMYITGTGIPKTLTSRMEEASRAFFALPLEQKMQIAMSKGGSAWRGYFPTGEELTSGKPDQKEGIYFGVEGDAHDTRALHGVNQWPADMEQYRVDVMEYLSHMKRVSTAVMGGIADFLYDFHEDGVDGAASKAFRASFDEPTELFRIFGYPSPQPTHVPDAHIGGGNFGVGEHTDYGYITVLYQDSTGGLQIKQSENNWLDVKPIEDTFVVNLGDALEHHSGGFFKATPHRVLHHRGGARDQLRVSFPYFFDPNMATDMAPMTFSRDKLNPTMEKSLGERMSRWDGEHLLQFRGEYGDYLLNKISRVFPTLFEKLVVPAIKTKKSHITEDVTNETTVDIVNEKVSDVTESATIVDQHSSDFEVMYDGHEETHNGETRAEFDERTQKEINEVFEWTARLHKSQGELTAEQIIEEEALRARMSAWMEENALKEATPREDL